MKIAIVFCLMAAFGAVVWQHHSQPSFQHSKMFGDRMIAGKLTEKGLDEISGCVASRANKDVLWVNNDSGDGPYVYAVGTDASLKCKVKLNGATNRDWEDIAIGPGPEAGKNYIYVADIGDNEAKYKTVNVYRFIEPTIPIGKHTLDVEAEAIEIAFPDGKRDAETLIIDPKTGDIYIVSKRERKGRVYTLKAPFTKNKVNTLSFVAELPFTLATGGDISAKGDEILIKNYVHVFYWSRKSNESLQAVFKRPPMTVSYMPEPQGEAICWSADANLYYTISERADATVDYCVNYYARQKKAEHVLPMSSTNQFSFILEPSADTEGIYLLRYDVPQQSTVKIVVFNEAMMVVENVEPATMEQGVQEREIDMIDKPDGSYVIAMSANGVYYATSLNIKRGK